MGSTLLVIDLSRTEKIFSKLGFRSSITRKIFYSANKLERISDAIGVSQMALILIEVAPVAAHKIVATAEIV